MRLRHAEGFSYRGIHCDDLGLIYTPDSKKL